MMKFSHAINTLVASVLVLPALTLQGGREGGLEHALSDTVRALEYLTGLESRVQKDARTSVPLLRDATEAPLPDARERDEKLVALRNEVARLQMIHDDLAGHANVASGGTSALAIDPDHVSSSIGVTTGLSDELRGSISGAPPPRPAHAVTGDTIETPGFCADPARRGQALYRAGRYEECAQFLATIENDVRAAYWLARAEEKLGRTEEALRGYRLVAQSKDDAALAERARADAEFLEWQRDFAKKTAAKTGTTGSSR
jgi:tetratricopeptide (TPR) repeat protein